MRKDVQIHRKEKSKETAHEFIITAPAIRYSYSDRKYFRVRLISSTIRIKCIPVYVVLSTEYLFTSGFFAKT